MSIPRSEYPRPQMERAPWLNLNGKWDFKYDDENLGIKNEWFKSGTYDKKIMVPYTYQSELSLINDKDFHDIIWYQRQFDLAEDMLGKRIILNLGAVDYKADVWVNGIYVKSHEGGHVPFSVEITNQVLEENNTITIRAEDDSFDLEIPRGKQYWEESLLTAPTDEDFIRDIKLAKEMRFNGVRKHQKIEDPRFLYHADKMGLLVWSEMPNAYVYSRKYVKRMTKEWMEAVERDYNHPCIVAWVPHNESWGVDSIKFKAEEQAYATSLYYLTKSLDQTRLVVSNDGWEHTKSDLLTAHDYEGNKETLRERYKSVENILAIKQHGRSLYAGDWSYEGQPILLTEMGGISYQTGEWEGWGYTSANSEEDFYERYYNIISPLLASPLIQGFAYTQITDVEQEINGLLTYAREPKVDLNIIRAINEGKWKPE